jgi:hypothetical protein
MTLCKMNKMDGKNMAKIPIRICAAFVI